MRVRLFGGLVARLVAGTAMSTLGGWIFFRSDVFDFGKVQSQCIVVGLLASGVIAVFRIGRPIWGLGLAAGFAVLQIVLASGGGVPRATTIGLWSLAVGLGLCVLAVVFHRLAQLNFLIGKFLVMGPLLGGIYFATTPLASLSAGRYGEALSYLWSNAYLGIIIGDGMALGMELVELVPWVRQTASAPLPAAAPGGHGS